MVLIDVRTGLSTTLRQDRLSSWAPMAKRPLPDQADPGWPQHQGVSGWSTAGELPTFVPGTEEAVLSLVCVPACLPASAVPRKHGRLIMLLLIVGLTMFSDSCSYRNAQLIPAALDHYVDSAHTLQVD